MEWPRRNPSMSSTASKCTRSNTARWSQKTRTASRTSRKDSKTASSISSFDAYFDPVFQTQPIGLFSKLHIVLLLKPGWIATPWLLWSFLDNLGLSLNMIYYVWMINPARTHRTRLLITLQILLQNVFKTKKSVSIKMGEMGFLENKGKTCLHEMDGDSCVECQMVCSYLCGWARLGDIHLVTIKDRVDVSLMCHLA